MLDITVSDGNQSPYLTSQEAARYLRITIQNLYQLTHRGLITFHKPNNKRLYFLKEDLDAWVKAGRYIAHWSMGCGLG